MQIVIDIDEKTYEHFKEVIPFTTNLYVVDAGIAIGKGIPLPKGHGDLISRQEVIKIAESTINGSVYFAYPTLNDFKSYINHLPTIIEADKGEEE